MLQFIRNRFSKPQSAPEPPVCPSKERWATTLTRHYLEMYITSLPRDEHYMVREETKSGSIVTHKVRCDWTEMRDYVRKVYIDAVPPRFIIIITPVK